MRKRKHPWWRPTKLDPIVVQKLCEILKIDWTVEEACRYAGIAKATFYSWLDSNQQFKDEIQAAQDFPWILARKVLFRSVASKNEGIAYKASVEYLSRRDKRYSNKYETMNKTERQLTEEDQAILKSLLKINGKKRK